MFVFLYVYELAVVLSAGCYANCDSKKVVHKAFR